MSYFAPRIDYAAANRGFSLLGSDLRSIASDYQRLAKRRRTKRRQQKLDALEREYLKIDSTFTGLAVAIGADPWEIRRRSWCNLRGIDWKTDEFSGAMETQS